jgi:hypothetical protein
MVGDDKPNVVPFTFRGISSADLGEPTDLTKVSMRVLLNSIEAYGFECEGGPLQNCAEWIELRRRLK